MAFLLVNKTLNLRTVTWSVIRGASRPYGIPRVFLVMSSCKLNPKP
jgi:hypothetical protein